MYIKSVHETYANFKYTQTGKDFRNITFSGMINIRPNKTTTVGFFTYAVTGGLLNIQSASIKQDYMSVLTI